MPEQDGWPRLSDVHREVTEMHREVTEVCAELRHLRETQDGQREELDAHGRDIRALREWRKWMAGGLAALSVVVLGAAVPASLTMIGG